MLKKNRVDRHRACCRWLLAVLVLLHPAFTAHAQVGTWNIYAAYHDIQDICATNDHQLFVLASNSLYQYNQNDQSITTFDKVNGLTDTGISLIAWNTQVRRLIAVYENANIDLLDTSGNTINISSLYSKTMTQDKTVNSIYIYQQYAYLATAFGIVKVNMEQAEVSESYILNLNASRVAIADGCIWLQTTDRQVWKATLSANLQNPANWAQTADYSESLFAASNSDYDTYYPTVSRLSPGGPKYNSFYESRFTGGRLYTTGGYFLSAKPGKDNPGIVQVYDGDNWTVFQDSLKAITGIDYADMNCIDIDPTDNNHVFVGGRSGLYEFQSGQFKTLYNKSNSPLRPAIDASKELPDDYTLVHGAKFDSQGNLWVLNSQARNTSLLELTKDGEWNDHSHEELLDDSQVSMSGMRRMLIDSMGRLWFVNTHYADPAVLCYDPRSDELYKYNRFSNQDGISYNVVEVYDIAEDLQQNIWVGTDKGLFYIDRNEAEQVGKEQATFCQVKVPRNDGTDYADYLLTGMSVSSIAIDGGNRKWIGTNGAGVFLISADNMQQLQHFTKDNSKLISNNIMSIAIDNQSGKTFFLTDNGLCSYISDATVAQETMTKDNVYAYPNPVTPDYTGLITVVGLSLNADVKIVSPSGKLIAEGRSNGGSFTWDGCDRQGRRVASGVYMVVTATSDGKKGTVCKIAIVK